MTADCSVGASNLKILGFLRNIGLSKKGVSGTLSLIDKHLKDRGCIVRVIDTEVYGMQDKINTIQNFHYNLNKWSFKKSINVEIKSLRSKKAEKEVLQVKSDYNSCFQIGSEFKIHHIQKLKNLPKFSYHDNNLMALLKSSKYSYNLPQHIKKAFRFEKDVYDNLDEIFTMTEFVRQSFIEDFSVSENRVHNVGFGANMSYDNIDREYDCRTVLFVAKDSFKEKGGELLLKAFRIAKMSQKNIRLILVGQDLNIDLPGVNVVGFIDKSSKEGTEKLKSYYRQASLFAMPSYVEAAGNVFLEAMAHKIPCIGADRGATPEIITGNKCGAVVEPGNEKELANKILDLLADECSLKKMGENGFLAIKKKYNWDIVCNKIISIIKNYV